MPRFMPNITFLAHCQTCNTDVSVLPLQNRYDLLIALQNRREVRVMHVVRERDHIWSLNSEDTISLSNAITQGLV